MEKYIIIIEEPDIRTENIKKIKISKRIKLYDFEEFDFFFRVFRLKCLTLPSKTSQEVLVEKANFFFFWGGGDGGGGQLVLQLLIFHYLWLRGGEQ